MPVEHSVPAMTNRDLLKVEVIAPDGDFSAWVRWNEPAVEEFRKRVGEEVASRQLRRLGADLVGSIEDVLARRDHPPGPCLPGCPHHANAVPANSPETP